MVKRKKSALIGLMVATALTLTGTATAAQPGPDDDEMVTDRLGTHKSSEVDSPDVNLRSGQASCGTFGEYGGGFNTSLGGGWQLLATRSAPCRASESSGDGWGTGSRFFVSREANGEFICRSRLQGVGTAVWFKTEKGFSWSGGTSDARWKHGCN